MFETPALLTSGDLVRLVEALPGLDGAVDDAERIDQIRALEQLKAAAAAAQARVTTQFAASQRMAQVAAGVPTGEVGRGIAGQVGLARRESPARARRYVGWAQVLVTELPGTFTALQRGDTTEWRAMIVARETAWLSAEHRALVDARLGPRLHSMGDRQVQAEVQRAAYRLDPHGYLGRVRGRDADRRVGIRPAPDAMARLSGFLPVAQAVAAYASLESAADSLVACGDRRSRGQIMADTMVQRLTGQASASAVPVTVNLVMTDRTLLNRGGTGTASADEPAHLDGYGPIPADLARRLVGDVPAETEVWLRRLYTDPDTGALVAMESRSRCFDHGIRRFLVLRDQICRTPWCNAPVRHADHVIPAAHGGRTSTANGQGLCQACNLAKQAHGWRARPDPTAPATRSSPPLPPATATPVQRRTRPAAHPRHRPSRPGHRRRRWSSTSATWSPPPSASRREPPRHLRRWCPVARRLGVAWAAAPRTPMAPAGVTPVAVNPPAGSAWPCPPERAWGPECPPAAGRRWPASVRRACPGSCRGRRGAGRGRAPGR
ncbi:MAG: DUF222 domain-containing protein [Actinomycetota bacterium]|nr:DUF222 domain-containing protein [Actinomycetota bacterium]